ncbi:PREDICTED: A-kinase anchor protein 13-like [Elephantulus edwardii]|uniref:A-kinase anchor protein 13-like n=1 Tax=Elephantulus edwardii TaxID=28737 RepID=UPI0003F0EFC6|nr:PREDICTED: A-kinase anchor protein 13-like [Elephantulus edwardii]
MVVLFNRVHSFGRDTHGSVREEGDTRLASQISRINPGDQWGDRCRSQITLTSKPGDCVVTILLAEEDKVEDDVVFYLIFSGSSLHHCTSTRKISPDTLETITPGHDCCETVKVLLCASKEGLPVFVVAEEDFHFIQDEAYDAAQFLATSAGNQQALNFTRFLDRSGPPSGDVNSLDEKVALAFRHLKLPAEWNVLGTDHTLEGEDSYDTLWHLICYVNVSI